MTTERQRTRQEEAYGRLLEENRGLLSGAANTVLETAEAGEAPTWPLRRAKPPKLSYRERPLTTTRVA